MPQVCVCRRALEGRGESIWLPGTAPPLPLPSRSGRPSSCLYLFSCLYPSSCLYLSGPLWGFKSTSNPPLLLNSQVETQKGDLAGPETTACPETPGHTAVPRAACASQRAPRWGFPSLSLQVLQNARDHVRELVQRRVLIPAEEKNVKGNARPSPPPQPSGVALSQSLRRPPFPPPLVLFPRPCPVP